MPRRTAFDPVTYSPATRRAIAKIEQQIELTQRYLADFRPNIGYVVAEQAKIVGLTIALTNIAEQHRQWQDYERWQTLQGIAHRSYSDLVFHRRLVLKETLDSPAVGAL